MRTEIVSKCQQSGLETDSGCWLVRRSNWSTCEVGSSIHSARLENSSTLATIPSCEAVVPSRVASSASSQAFMPAVGTNALLDKKIASCMAEIIDSRLNNLFKSTGVGEFDRHILVFAIAVFCCVRCSTDAGTV